MRVRYQRGGLHGLQSTYRLGRGELESEKGVLANNIVGAYIDDRSKAKHTTRSEDAVSDSRCSVDDLPYPIRILTRI